MFLIQVEIEFTAGMMSFFWQCHKTSQKLLYTRLWGVKIVNLMHQPATHAEDFWQLLIHGAIGTSVCAATRGNQWPQADTQTVSQCHVFKGIIFPSVSLHFLSHYFSTVSFLFCPFHLSSYCVYFAYAKPTFLSLFTVPVFKIIIKFNK